MSFSSLLAKVSNKPVSPSPPAAAPVKSTVKASRAPGPVASSVPHNDSQSKDGSVTTSQRSYSSQDSGSVSKEKQLQMEKIARLKAERAKERGVSSVNPSKPRGTNIKKSQSSHNSSSSSHASSFLTAKTGSNKITKDRRTTGSTTNSESKSAFIEPPPVAAPKKKLKFSDLLQHAEKNYDPNKVKMTVKVKDSKARPVPNTVSSASASALASATLAPASSPRASINSSNEKTQNLHSSRHARPSLSRDSRGNSAPVSSRPTSLSSSVLLKDNTKTRPGGQTRPSTNMASPSRIGGMDSSRSATRKPISNQRPTSRLSDSTKQSKIKELPSRHISKSTPAPFSRPSDRLLKKLETVKHRRNGEYDSDSSLDDFVVEDEDEDPGYIDAKTDIWSLVNGNRRRAWVDDDEFDDDMEATGEDIFDEERRSEYVAKYEDKKEEFAEKKRAEEKKKRRI